MTEQRRRIDIVLQPEYLEGLSDLSLDELRKRRTTAADVEAQVSYYRRMIHGRMDLLDFELRRREGKEERTLLEALPEILASGMILGNEPNLRHIEVMPPIPSQTGRRLIDKIMDEGVLIRLPDMSTEDIGEALNRLRDFETQLSNQRRDLHTVIDTLQDEIVGRYRNQQDEAAVSG